MSSPVNLGLPYVAFIRHPAVSPTKAIVTVAKITSIYIHMAFLGDRSGDGHMSAHPVLM